jgi:ATP-binding cassette subfamily F protein 1
LIFRKKARAEIQRQKAEAYDRMMNPSSSSGEYESEESSIEEDHNVLVDAAKAEHQQEFGDWVVLPDSQQQDEKTAAAEMRDSQHRQKLEEERERRLKVLERERMLEEKEQARRAKKEAEANALKEKAASGAKLSNKDKRQLEKILAEEARQEEELQAVEAYAAAGELRNFTLDLPKERGEMQGIHVEGFSLHVAGKTLFADADLKIHSGQRYGLHGPNGQGKTSLLKHIAHRKFPSPGNWDIFCVDQEAAPSRNSVVDEVLASHSTRNALLEEEAVLMDQINNSPPGDVANLVERLQYIDNELSAMGSEAMEAEVRKILAGLGFSLDNQERAVSTFSGGWRMRVSLAKALFIKPRLLLLDEVLSNFSSHV